MELFTGFVRRPCSWITVNPGKSGYAQASNSMLNTSDCNLKETVTRTLFNAGATIPFLVTDTPVRGMSMTTKPTTVTIIDGYKLTSKHQQELNLPLPTTAAWIVHVIPGVSSYHTHSCLVVHYSMQDVQYFLKNLGLVSPSHTGV